MAGAPGTQLPDVVRTLMEVAQKSALPALSLAAQFTKLHTEVGTGKRNTSDRVAERVFREVGAGARFADRKNQSVRAWHGGCRRCAVVFRILQEVGCPHLYHLCRHDIDTQTIVAHDQALCSFFT